MTWKQLSLYLTISVMTPPVTNSFPAQRASNALSPNKLLYKQSSCGDLRWLTQTAMGLVQRWTNQRWCLGNADRNVLIYLNKSYVEIWYDVMGVGCGGQWWGCSWSEKYQSVVGVINTKKLLTKSFCRNVWSWLANAKTPGNCQQTLWSKLFLFKVF